MMHCININKPPYIKYMHPLLSQSSLKCMNKKKKQIIKKILKNIKRFHIDAIGIEQHIAFDYCIIVYHRRQKSIKSNNGDTTAIIAHAR